MSNVWDGTYLWSWKANGNVNDLIAQAKALGVTGILIKFANGSLVGDTVSQEYMARFKQLAPLFKASGFRVGGWIYQYLTDVQGEVDACSQAIDAGAEWIVLDGEVELKGKMTQVQQFGMLLRAKYPNIPLGLSSFSIADYHPEVPFTEYSQFVDVMMPQVYWAEMGWDVAVAFNASIASYKKFGKPIAPTGQSYGGATPADMARFIQLCKGAGFTHASWWDWDEATSSHLQAIQSNLIQPPAAEPIKPFDKVAAQKVIDILGAVYNASLDPAVQQASHFAADALRDAAGIPK
jgi:hypothetical protein